MMARIGPFFSPRERERVGTHPGAGRAPSRPQGGPGRRGDDPDTIPIGQLAGTKPRPPRRGQLLPPASTPPAPHGVARGRPVHAGDGQDRGRPLPEAPRARPEGSPRRPGLPRPGPAVGPRQAGGEVRRGLGEDLPGGSPRPTPAGARRPEPRTGRAALPRAAPQAGRPRVQRQAWPGRAGRRVRGSGGRPPIVPGRRRKSRGDLGALDVDDLGGDVPRVDGRRSPPQSRSSGPRRRHRPRGRAGRGGRGGRGRHHLQRSERLGLDQILPGPPAAPRRLQAAMQVHATNGVEPRGQGRRARGLGLPRGRTAAGTPRRGAGGRRSEIDRRVSDGEAQRPPGPAGAVPGGPRRGGAGRGNRFGDRRDIAP